MKTGRPAVPIELSDEERSELLRRSRQRKGPAESRIRAEIILACASGESGTSIANRFGIGVHTVSRWRVRFSRLRLDGLNDEQRSGRPRSITDEQVQAVVDQVLKSKPKDASHWSTRSMSQATGISPASVMRIWHAFGLGPDEKFCGSGLVPRWSAKRSCTRYQMVSKKPRTQALLPRCGRSRGKPAPDARAQRGVSCPWTTRKCSVTKNACSGSSGCVCARQTPAHACSSSIAPGRAPSPGTTTTAIRTRWRNGTTI